MCIVLSCVYALLYRMCVLSLVCSYMKLLLYHRSFSSVLQIDIVIMRSVHRHVCFVELLN